MRYATRLAIGLVLLLVIVAHAQDMAAIYADKKPSGELVNIMQSGCPVTPPHKDCKLAHSDPAKGCDRVVLEAWPADGLDGPFTFTQTGKDKATGLPLGQAIGKPISLERQLDAVPCEPRVIRAMCCRLSDSWEKLPDEQKAIAQKLIDGCGANVAAALGK